jgi:HlyD family secretion protein
MKAIIKWGVIIIVGAGLVAGGLWVTGIWRPTSLSSAPTAIPTGSLTIAGSGDSAGGIASTIAVRSAAEIIGQISAAGQIALSDIDYVVLKADGDVQEVLVQPGDSVKAGDLLLTLDTTDLERAVMRAQLNVDSAQNALAQLKEPADANELAQAEAELKAAEDNLVDAQQPATQAELNAAQASLAAAVAKYNDLTAPTSNEEITTLEANLRRAEIALQEAQRNYDQVAWRNDIGMTSQAADLQQASIDYEAAQAEYGINTQPASQTDIQSANSSIQQARQTLDELKSKPNTADIASAEAQVASARANLEKLQQGASALEIEASELQLKSALVDLEEALATLDAAQVRASSDGVALAVHVEEGLPAKSGDIAVELANLSQLEMTVDVAEVDIDKISIGQAAQVSLDALPDREFQGQVARISPVSNSSEGVVSYKVTLQILESQEGDLDGVLPDMTAVARLDNPSAANGWLVPSTALQEVNGETTVQVVEGGQARSVPVETGVIQGEWVVVYSNELDAGDQVIGEVASKLDGNQGGFIMGGPPPGGGMRP